MSSKQKTTIAAQQSSSHAHPVEEIVRALNRAADDILDAVNAPGTGLRDGLNLMVNATADYLRNQSSDLRSVIKDNYDASYKTVLGWIAGDDL
ncbi:hypothetical protein [Fodinicola feengrottensis]|uniref:Uncharacterized protein n=1 Tax=Fodinicola feengrottensis TaxID=435914 RepID=A0ABN2GM70_9ACTN|nr:hypothetical protein [Fodinicola feengrottensis]